MRPNCAISKSAHDRKLWSFHCFSCKFSKKWWCSFSNLISFDVHDFTKVGGHLILQIIYMPKELFHCLLSEIIKFDRALGGFSGTLGGFAGVYIKDINIYDFDECHHWWWMVVVTCCCYVGISLRESYVPLMQISGSCDEMLKIWLPPGGVRDIQYQRYKYLWFRWMSSLMMNGCGDVLLFYIYRLTKKYRVHRGKYRVMWLIEYMSGRLHSISKSTRYKNDQFWSYLKIEL